MHVSADIQKYLFRLRFQEDARLPAFVGNTLRGGFGYAFKQVSCALKRQGCEDCLIRDKCAYAYIFETPPPADSSMMRLYPSVPHPFVIEPPEYTARMQKKGSSMEMALLLIGRGINYLPYFLYAFENLGQRGLGKDRASFKVEEVLGLSPDGSCTSIYEPGTGKLDSYEPKWSFLFPGRSSESCDCIKLKIKSPLAVKHQGRIAKSLDFHVLFRNMLRRISALCYFHCGIDMANFDFREWVEKSQSIETVSSNLKFVNYERYSTRQKSRMKIGGLIGEITYAGDIGPFLPFLQFGALFHTGKNTSFGLGKFEIERLEVQCTKESAI